MTHISSTADHSEDALLAQKITTIIHAYGKDGEYVNKDIHFLIEQVPNIRKVLVLLNYQDRVNSVMAFEYRYVEGQGAQGELAIHRPNGDLWEGLINSLYPAAHKIVLAQRTHTH